MKRLSGILLIVFAFSVFADEIQVLNEGIGGNNTRSALARIYESVIAYAPQCVIVGFGGNDAFNYSALVPAAEYEENLTKIVQQLKEANVREIVLNTPHPIIESYLRARSPKLDADHDINGTVRQYREIVQKVAREQNVQMLDVYEMVVRNNDPSEAKESMLRNTANSNSRDGVHFTADAYQKIADALYELLKNRIKPGDKIVCFGDSLTYGANLAGAGTVTGKNYPSFLWKKFNPTQENPTRMRSKLETDDGSVLQNGGFEFANASNMPYKWVMAKNPKHIGEVRTGESPEGTRFFHMENNGSNKTLLRTDFIRENGKFAFSCLVRGEGKLETKVVLYGKKMETMQLLDTDLTGTWQKIEGDFEVPSENSFVIMLQAHKSVDIDDVKVIPADLKKKSSMKH